jgi:hypothetical protein
MMAHAALAHHRDVSQKDNANQVRACISALLASLGYVASASRGNGASFALFSEAPALRLMAIRETS